MIVMNHLEVLTVGNDAVGYLGDNFEVHASHVYQSIAMVNNTGRYGAGAFIDCDEGCPSD